MSPMINPTTWELLSLGIFRFAEMHSCTNLKLEAKRFIERRFTDVIKEDEFYELPKETLQHFLKSEGLSIDSEFQVFEATMRWILHDVRERRPLVFDVLDAVRFPVISQKQLDRYVSDCPDMSLRVALLKLMQDLKHDSRANQRLLYGRRPAGVSASAFVVCRCGGDGKTLFFSPFVA
ncbi:hypothetical protein HPB47_012205 [Ixodes persulcatus]|uniref:Uncharacterized protein n=1 Tax=Ixodes persulcatus TaxID=34615 RepID=A0AC60NUA3_IXOPE|nr:hypothetical protein HPB47_012205 [Ixodes persulcatus]